MRKLGAGISTAPIHDFGESEMTELKVLVLGGTFGLLVAFGIRALASWLTLRARNKQLSHYIKTLRGS